MSFNYYGTPGEYAGHANIRVQENRTIVYTSTGEKKVEVTPVTIGGTTSSGATITQTKNIQNYFNYDCDFIFFGTNTGYYGSAQDYNLHGLGMGFHQLLKPIIGTTSEVITFTGLNRN
ncbi:hypothetical protein [Mucilaginibacter terrae]|uniref:Uncharacterized protein n=1 Tax=Mucilaginibacter terrae TaxID=1955052 RepID=A0ABU3GT79_9SPHI|nr:hypothetical protein [Mucilaginibacter terrae]MDT3402988.1 hypothetical protein [Mucilaginibacter terrae]